MCICVCVYTRSCSATTYDYAYTCHCTPCVSQGIIFHCTAGANIIYATSYATPPLFKCNTPLFKCSTPFFFFKCLTL